ncbi:MAG: hypothetical protein HYR56_23120 [Acidobacteria bacterium]|nr:hypothetical protein [Acidobacteriota bacterium]MBI3427837.1 hypothetical protein [Acidobacteriota bacterium]
MKTALKPINSSGVLAAAVLWLLLALGFGLAGLPRYLTPPLPQVMIFGLTATLLLLFCLLLTFLVPIIIASHIVIFVRLWRSKGAGYATV